MRILPLILPALVLIGCSGEPSREEVYEPAIEFDDEMSSGKADLLSWIKHGFSIGCSFDSAEYKTADSVNHTVNVCNFRPVSPGLFRGGRPRNAQEFADLKAIGVKNILFLDNLYALEDETALAKAAGINVISEHVEVRSTPTDEQINRILKMMVNPELQPIFMHCRVGRDRTGLLTALHRVFNQGWDPKKAHTEMVDYGFHPIFYDLHRYFHTRTETNVEQ